MYRKISNILFWFFFILSIILFIRMIVGYSPTTDQLLMAILSGFFVKMNSDIGQIRERAGVLNEKFIVLNEKLTVLNKRVGKIELKLKL